MASGDEQTLTLTSSDFACDDLHVRAFTGSETIGRLFEYTVTIVGPRRDGPGAAEMIGARVTLVIERHGGGGAIDARRLHGMVAEVADDLDAHAELRVHRLRIVPRAFALTQVETHDVFVNQSVPDIVQEKLTAVNLGSAHALRLSGVHAARELVVQYGESDLAFVSRLVEHLGVSFFFEHGDNEEIIVFTDRADGFGHVAEGPPIVFCPRGERHDVFALAATTRMIPAYFAVRDYNYRTPLVDIVGEHELTQGTAGGVIELGTHHKTPAEGEALARVRAEERLCGQLVYRGKSTLPALGAGLRFTLEDHPDLGTIDLLVTRVDHRASQVVAGVSHDTAPGYENSFEAIPAERVYRPARVTPRPKIAGLVHGIVDAGPVGGHPKQAQIDPQGRYWVRFLLDTTPAGERPASHPIRMLQNHAGANYGTHFPLKPGIEVMVGFLDGDPDRPVIVGAVPNPTTPSAVTSAETGVHRIRTSTGVTIDIHD